MNANATIPCIKWDITGWDALAAQWQGKQEEKNLRISRLISGHT